MLKWAFLFVLFLALFLTCPALAQEADSTEARVKITLQDGSELVGQVIAETDSTLEFRTTGGVRVSVPKSQIAEREMLLQRERAGRFFPSDPNDTRLIFAPTARPLGKGRGYFSVYEVFFPFVAIGAGERWSLAGGMSLVPGVEEQLFYAAPKVTLLQQPRSAVALGGFIGTVLGESSDGYGGVLYGLTTLGRSSGAVTLGIGAAFGDEGVFTEQPVFVAGAEYQVSDHAKFLSENYVFVGEESSVLLSGGIRFFGDNLAAGLSFFVSPDLLRETEGFPFIPFLSFTYNFGR